MILESIILCPILGYQLTSSKNKTFQASSYPDGSAGVVKGSAVPGSGGGTRRSSAQGWTSSLAPRFERKAVAKAEQKHIYYEGELCVAEDLLNGFTKIRNGNLVKCFSYLISQSKIYIIKIKE